MLDWKEYPTISKIEGEEVFLEKPCGKELIETIESLKEDEYLVLDFDVMPYNKKFQRKYHSSEFMKQGPELKIRIVDEPARIHIENELKRYDFKRPKRGYKWTNPENKTSTFVPLTNLIDGAKIFAYSVRGEIDNITTGKHSRATWAKVPSRKESEHKVIFNPVPRPSGKDWYRFKGFCDCGESFYYGHISRKYTNSEIYMCPHIIAGYHMHMKSFDKSKEGDPVPALFPVPTEEKMVFDKKGKR